MDAKYAHIRSHLDRARGWLDGSSEIDRQLAKVLEQLSETVLYIEHTAAAAPPNVVQFQPRKQNS